MSPLATVRTSLREGNLDLAAETMVSMYWQRGFGDAYVNLHWSERVKF
jgi:hypothetical protein